MNDKENMFQGQMYSASDIGIKRKNNEDAAYSAKSQYGVLLLVADGMGGHRKGEVASKLVVDTLSYSFAKARHTFNRFRSHLFLVNNSKDANKQIYKMAISSDEYREMGTTESAALIGQDGTTIFSVGDSRVYSFKKGVGLTQISKDQSYVELLFETGRIDKDEMKTHPQRNILTNAVGLNATLSNYEEFFIPNDSYDKLLLCTDGLFNMVSDEEIKTVLEKEETIEEKAKELIQLALEHGGNDNVAVVLWEK